MLACWLPLYWQLLSCLQICFFLVFFFFFFIAQTPLKKRTVNSFGSCSTCFCFMTGWRGRWIVSYTVLHQGCQTYSLLTLSGLQHCSSWPRKLPEVGGWGLPQNSGALGPAGHSCLWQEGVQGQQWHSSALPWCPRTTATGPIAIAAMGPVIQIWPRVWWHFWYTQLVSLKTCLDYCCFILPLLLYLQISFSSCCTLWLLLPIVG